METAGTATRTPGPANGNRKSADLWHPAPTVEAPVADESTGTADDVPAADDTTTATDDAAANDTDTADDNDAPTVDDSTDEAPASDDTTGAPDEEAAPDDRTDEAPTAEKTTDAPEEVPVGPRQPDLKVLMMAGVLGDHPGGVTAAEAITQSGLAPAVGDTILAAMEVAGAAKRLPVADDGTELWMRGDADLATVDPAKAPTHVVCQTCGHTRPIRRTGATGRRANGTGGTGRASGVINSDGSQKLAKGELERQVEAFMRDLGPGHRLSPVTMGRELGGRSSGACGNAMDKMTGRGVLVLVSEAPRLFELADNPPPPSPEVAALMTRATAPAADASDDARSAANTDDTPAVRDAPAAAEAGIA